MTRIIHPWIGVVLFFSFAGLFIRFWRANLWEREDSVWLASPGLVLRGEDERLPEIGRYNAGQKLVFWGMTLLILVLFASGLVIWDTYFFALHLDRDEAGGDRGACRGGGVRDPDLDRACLRGDLGARHGAGDDARLGDRRVGVAASPEVAAGRGGEGAGGRRVTFPWRCDPASKQGFNTEDERRATEQQEFWRFAQVSVPTPREVDQCLLRGPPWPSVSSVLNPCLLAMQRTPRPHHRNVPTAPHRDVRIR